jgi:hypothetical protein
VHGRHLQSWERCTRDQVEALEPNQDPESPAAIGKSAWPRRLALFVRWPNSSAAVARLAASLTDLLPSGCSLLATGAYLVRPRVRDKT